MIIRWLLTLLVRLSPLYFLITAVNEIGWSIVVDTDSETVEGLIIGTDTFIEKHTADDGEK